MSRSITCLPHLAWAVARDQAMADMDEDLGGPGVCAWSGVECHETWPFSPSENFGDWSSIARPDSTSAHPGCAWLAGSSSVVGPSGKRLRWTLLSIRASEACGVEGRTKAQKSDIRRWLIDPPDGLWSAVITDTGKKHLAWRTPVNRSRERYVVRFEELLVDVELADMRALLTDVETLYHAGIPKSDMLGGSTSVVRFSRFDPAERAAWERVRSRTHDPRLALAVWVATKEETSTTS